MYILNTKWKLKNKQLILTYIEITSIKIIHSNLLVSVILPFINEHYRKTNKGKKEYKNNSSNNNNKKQNKKQKKTRIEINCPRPPSLFTLKEILISNVINRTPFI